MGRKTSFKLICHLWAGVYNKITVKPILSGCSKRRPNIVFSDWFLLNAGQMYCRMLLESFFAILSTFIKLPFVFKTFVLSIFERPLKTGFTSVISSQENHSLASQGLPFSWESP